MYVLAMINDVTMNYDEVSLCWLMTRTHAVFFNLTRKALTT